MKLKTLFITIAWSALIFSVDAQNSVYWRSSNSTGYWQFGTGCASWDNDGNWYYPLPSGNGNRQRPDCDGTFNIIYFDNNNNPNMDLNSGQDYSANQIQFITGTPDRTITASSGKGIYFRNNGSNCKIENYVTFTTHTFNVDIFVNSGGNYLEINPVNGYLLFNNTVRNNSDNPITIYGAQQVTFSGDIAGTPGITINNTATVVYSGSSKTYSGTTTINNGTKLRISTNQTLGNLVLNGGTLQVDLGATLTLTGTYSSTGGTIDNKGTIKFAGGSVTFPGLATVNNGVANTLSNIEAASSGIVTINSILNVTNSITVSEGTLKLGGYNLHLNGATLNIASGATFDNDGENQIINGGGIINITGIFITRDAQGFVGANTAIPTITPTLNNGSTVEYGLSGDQAVQGSTAPTYNNVTFSGSGTKTLISGNNVSGTITVSGTAIFDAGNFTFGGSGTNITMTGTSIYKLGGSGTKPTATGIYSLGSLSTIDFSGTSATNIRLSAPTITYANIIVSGTNVSNSGTSTGIKFQTSGTFIVKTSGTFKINTTAGFTGGTNTAINIITNGGPTITLETGSTIEYAGANQNITEFSPAYSNLTISGSGIKTTTATTINVGNDLNITAAQLTIEDEQTFMVTNKVNNSGGIFLIENNGSLVQVNDNAINTGNITYKRITPPIFRTDYTYWSSPVASQTLYNVSPTTLAGMFYSYDASTENWIEEASSNNMIECKGYIIRGPEQPFQVNYKASFYGKPNNGAYSITGIIEDRLYLIGNPYPSALDADTFLNTNAGVLDGTLYFWTHNTDMQLRTDFLDPTKAGSGLYAYTADDYASYNVTGGVGIAPYISASAPNGTTVGNNNNKPSGKIASGQGFFATSNTTIIGLNEIIFNNSMRVRTTAKNNQFFRIANSTKSAIIEKHRIWLNLTNTQGAFKQTLVGYITDATNEHESRFDGESFDAHEFVDFYSMNQEKNLVIQGRALPFNENDEVPLGFRTSIEGAFTINIDQVDGVLTNQSVFIEDKLMNTVFDLKTENYTFNTVAGTFNDRFILCYTNKTLSNKDFETLENQMLVSNKNKQIKVNSTTETIDKVTIYDLLGRQLFKKDKVNSNELTIPNIVSSQQTILVNVSLQNGQTVTKKIIY